MCFKIKNNFVDVNVNDFFPVSHVIANMPGETCGSIIIEVFCHSYTYKASETGHPSYICYLLSFACRLLSSEFSPHVDLSTSLVLKYNRSISHSAPAFLVE